MITIQNERIASVPVLHVVKEINSGKKVPTIFFLHGFTSAKEHNLHVAYLLAEKGFRVILPDALHHGEREQLVKGGERELSFWEIVLTSIKEIGELKNELECRDIIDENRIGMIGTSMGAITMYGALTAYTWIKTAVSFMGTAYYEQLARSQLMMLKEKGVYLEEEKAEHILAKIRKYDLSVQLEKIAGRPLFIWHGREDRVVPYAFSEKLYDELAHLYGRKQEQLQFISEENVSHKVSRLAVLKSVDWFNHHLDMTQASSKW